MGAQYTTALQAYVEAQTTTEQAFGPYRAQAVCDLFLVHTMEQLKSVSEQSDLVLR